MLFLRCNCRFVQKVQRVSFEWQTTKELQTPCISEFCVCLLFNIQRLAENSIHREDVQREPEWLPWKDWLPRHQKRISHSRWGKATCCNTLQDTSVKGSLSLLVPYGTTYQRYSQSSVVWLWVSSRQRLLHPNTHTEDQDWSDTTYQLRSVWTLWRGRIWQSIQGTNKEYDQLSTQTLVGRSWDRKARNISLL